MRAVIYCCRDDAGNVDLKTAMCDRDVEGNMAAANKERRDRPGLGEELSWDDQEPVALVEINGATIIDGELCFGGMAQLAREVLARGSSSSMGITVTRLDGGEYGTLELGD